MKLLIIVILLVFPIQWETNFENAKEHAKEQHKFILLNFSGSDWCGPCMIFKKDYLESEKFLNIASEHLIMFNADFPRKKKNMSTPEQTKENAALATKYNKTGSFPLTLLLDADGNIIKSWIGKPDVATESWVAEVKSICEMNKIKM